MATVSFNKDIRFNQSEELKRFAHALEKKNTVQFIDKEKVSDKVMARSEAILKQYLSR